MKKYFESISDPCQPWKTEHNLPELIIMTICAVMSGCEYWEDTIVFSKVKGSMVSKKVGAET